MNKNNLKRAAEELRVQKRQKAKVKGTSSNMSPLNLGVPRVLRSPTQRRAMNASGLQAVMIEERKNGKYHQRLQRGTLESIIARAKQMYDVEDHIRISKSTICSKCMRTCVQPPVQQGTPSPMLGIEPHLVKLIIQLARMPCPFNVTSGLVLANSLIAGTPNNL